MLIDLMADEMVCGCATLILRNDELSARSRKRGNGGSQDDAGPELLSTEDSNASQAAIQDVPSLQGEPKKRSTLIQHLLARHLMSIKVPRWGPDTLPSPLSSSNRGLGLTAF
jgi:hypothetical protein